MAITAASVEANGWVLRVTLTGALSSSFVGGFSTLPANDNRAQWLANLGAYATAPNTGMPCTLAMASNGYVQSGGTAVASAVVGRALTVTRPLRKAVVTGAAAGSRQPQQPDETDNGDGTITVRLALSQHVYAGDSGLTLAVAAGWRSGEAAATGIAVTNNSTVAAPAPIVRWADVPYQLQPGSFTLECVAVSHHPNGLAPVAGVKFTVTDGTTVKSFWTTALSTSTKYSAGGTGLPLRVYAVTVDPTTATALTQGLLRCDFEVYPWIGPVQKSDPTAAKSMAGLGTAAFSTNAWSPFVVAYNPGNAWIVPRFVAVDEVNGTGTATSVTVATTAAAALAGTPANSINIAHQAIENVNATVVAANGQATITKSSDGATIIIKKPNASPGTTGIANGCGTVAVGTGVQTLASWLTVMGDPGDTTGRACILRSPSVTAASNRMTRVRLTGLSIEAQTVTCLAALYTWLDNFEVRAVSGQTATSGNPVGATSGQQYLTNGKWWQHGSAPTVSGSTMSPLLIRNVAAERSFGAQIVANCARLATAIAGTTAVTTGESSASGLGNVEGIVIGCDLRYSSSSPSWITASLANAAAPANLTLGTTNTVRSRQAFVNNICEQFGGSGSPMWNQIGENGLVTSTEIVIEGNTFTGDRTNCPYGDLNLATVALNDTSDNTIRVYRFANNIMMKAASKHDAFNDPTVQAQRFGVALATTRSKAYAVGAEVVISGSPANIYHCTTAGTTAATGGPTGTGSAISDGTVVWQWIATENRQHGYRPNAIGAWSSYYGVGAEGNVDFQPASSADPEFEFAFFGLGSDQLSIEGISVAATPFTSDASGGPNRMPFQGPGTGGGNYKPLTTGTGTYALARARTANVDTDGRGVARAVPFTAGAIEAAAVTGVTPASTRSASRAAVSAVGWSTGVITASARMVSRAAAAATGWSTSLGSAAARMPSRAASGGAGWATTLAAQATVAATRAAITTLSWTVTLGVGGARSASAAVPSVATWLTTLPPDRGLIATLATESAVGSAVTTPVVGDNGRIAIVDQTLPILLPGTLTPADRTLTISGEFRTLIVQGSPTCF